MYFCIKNNIPVLIQTLDIFMTSGEDQKGLSENICTVKDPFIMLFVIKS